MSSFMGEPMPDKPSGASEPQRTEPQRTDPQRTDPRDSNLLERVLQETLADHSVEQLSPEDLEVLRAIARRYRGANLVLEPVATELVEAMLRTRFRDLRVHEGFWQQASRRIALTLWESPDGQQRLSHFWYQLCELTQ